MTHRQDQGFTLLEVLVAMGLSMVAVSGASSLFTLSLRAVRDSRDVSVETMLAVQKLEQLSAAVWGSSVLVQSPTGALDRDTPGYFDRIDTQGRVVTAGARPGSGVFVRRWAVHAAPVGSGAAVVLQVRVTTPRQDSGNHPVSPPAPRGGDVVLTTLRALGSY